LLDAEEQAVFRRLAVFAGGFTLDGAEAVVNPGGGMDVMGLVERLCEHSLLRSEDGAGDEPRFGLLETVREFAAERLTESGEEEATRDAHSAFFRKLVDQARTGMEGPDEAAWHARLAIEHANVRVALGWLLERQEAENRRRPGCRHPVLLGVPISLCRGNQLARTGACGGWPDTDARAGMRTALVGQPRLRQR
jgi:predicted ATPase